MRFYGWSWAELMSTPIFGFWTCYRQMHRLQAQEQLAHIRLDGACNTSDLAVRKSYCTDLQETLGTVVTHKAPATRNLVKGAIGKLKDLARAF